MTQDSDRLRVAAARGEERRRRQAEGAGGETTWDELWQMWVEHAEPFRSDAGYHIWLKRNYLPPRPKPKPPTVSEAAWEVVRQSKGLIDTKKPIFPPWRAAVEQLEEALEREFPREAKR